MGLASVPSAEQNCMPASSAPTLPQASGLSALSLSRNASPTSARNECTFFSLRATVERETSAASGRPDDPRRALNDLFKK
jgi:hypothetical protein